MDAERAKKWAEYAAERERRWAQGQRQQRRAFGWFVAVLVAVPLLLVAVVVLAFRLL